MVDADPEKTYRAVHDVEARGFAEFAAPGHGKVTSVRRCPYGRAARW
ncbi:hypothetical protein [Saccharothrix syringae]|nr:hypothetical protein [Saccharothrix syringae]